VEEGIWKGRNVAELSRRDGKLWCAVRTYADTKIALHFSHFKVLDSSRVTCFTDEPHKCRGDEQDPEAVEVDPRPN
jgi:hypothetical protein